MEVRLIFQVVLIAIYSALTATDSSCDGFNSHLVTRTEWGADAPNESIPLNPIAVPVCGVFVHHSSGCHCFSERSCRVRAREIQSEHLQRPGYADIGYTFLIDEWGRIYEGRGWTAMGAHAPGNNEWSYGIAVIGNYMENAPHERALQALEHILQCGVYLNYIASNYRLYGHRDGRCTLCPGDALYERIQQHSHYSYQQITYLCPEEPELNSPLPTPTCGIRVNTTVSEDTACSKVKGKFMNRRSWGAVAPSVRLDPVQVPMCGVFIHHTTSSCSSEQNCIARVYNTQQDQKNRGYDDIAYSFLIDPEGHIFEGRGWTAQGAHAEGNNDWSYGVAFIGNFMNTLPTRASFNSLESLLQCGIKLGYIVENYRLYGHKDGKCTDCPGDRLYAHIQSFTHYSNASINYTCATGNRPQSTPSCGVRSWRRVMIEHTPSAGNQRPVEFRMSCKKMADDGNCLFYSECVQKKKPCSNETGYPMAFAYKFCQKMNLEYDDFTEQEKAWVDAVKVCLMQELLGLIYNMQVTCQQITQTAMFSHRKCFIKSGPGICALPDESITTLSSLAVTNDQHYRTHWRKMWEQVTLDLWACRKTGSTLEWIKDKARKIKCALWRSEQIKLDICEENPDICPFLYMHHYRGRRNAEGTVDTVATFASNGDCRFWELLEEAFPCRKALGSSFAFSALLPICNKFKRYEHTRPASPVGRWMQRTQRCLMSNVLYFFDNATLDCSQSDQDIISNMIPCMVDAGFCDLDREDEFFLDKAFNLKGYPIQTPTEYTTYPLTNRTQRVDTEYFHYMSLIKELLTDVNYECFQRHERLSPDLYELVYSPTYNVMMKIRTEN